MYWPRMSIDEAPKVFFSCTGFCEGTCATIALENASHLLSVVLNLKRISFPQDNPSLDCWIVRTSSFLLKSSSMIRLSLAFEVTHMLRFSSLVVYRNCVISLEVGRNSRYTGSAESICEKSRSMSMQNAIGFLLNGAGCDMRFLFITKHTSL